MHIFGAFLCLSFVLVIMFLAIVKAIAESSASVKVLPKGVRGFVPRSDEVVKQPQATRLTESELPTTASPPPPPVAEKGAESSLRPSRLNEFIGQTSIEENLRVYLRAAIKRREALDHVLLTGPPGLGKTTLAHIIANEMGGRLHSTSGPAITKISDITALLTLLEEGDVLFIDQIHRLLPPLEKKFYPAMKDFILEFMVGQKAAARLIDLELPKFTLVGATTRPALINAQLGSCFGINFHLDFYAHEDLQTICKRSATILKAEIDDDGAREIALRSRGTPRMVHILLRRVLDFAIVDYDGRITLEVASDALNRMGVDRYGLNDLDRRLLLAIIEKFEGGPVGLDALSAAIHEDKDSIEEIVEPYLLQIGFLSHTPYGRVATELARQHLSTPMDPQPPGLFD